jgi:hypothetical protein
MFFCFVFSFHMYTPYGFWLLTLVPILGVGMNRQPLRSLFVKFTPRMYPQIEIGDERLSFL